MKFCLPCSKYFSPAPKPAFDNSGKDEQGLETLPHFHVFSYKELKAATQGFRSHNKVGEGSFGCVYKGRLRDGTVVAVKVLSVESKQGEREFMAEIAAMSNARHENLVQLHGACVDGPNRILVYDYMENNSLAQTLLEQNRTMLSWKLRLKISLGVARSLAYLHEEVKPHIVHRDIKASNILLDQDFTPKVSDFGLSKLFTDDNATHISTRVAGTLGYLAPEYAISGHLTRKSDIYSFGVLLLEILTGRPVVDFDLELGEHYVVEKAWEMYKANKLLELIDPTLKGDFPEEEAVRFLKVGLLCVQETPVLRPQMSTAIKMMSDEMDIKDIQISRPGFITDLMGVKTGHKHTSQSTATSKGSTSTTLSIRSSQHNLL